MTPPLSLHIFFILLYFFVHIPILYLAIILSRFIQLVFFHCSGDYETITRPSQVIRLPRRSASEQVRPRSPISDINEDHKKLRKARGSHVVIGDDNVDFPSSPVPSPAGSPAKHAANVSN